MNKTSAISETISSAARELGRLGRAAMTKAQAAASRANGKKGGRPKKARSPARYAISNASGVSCVASSRTMLGAKREASAQATFGGGDVEIVDLETGERWRRVFWQKLHCFGWEPWEEVG